MKYKLILVTLFYAMLLSVMIACSHDDSTGSPQKVDITKRTLFKLTFVDYNNEDTIEGTRAATIPPKKMIIPMGDIFAEVSIERDTTHFSAQKQVVKTRADEDKRYKIFAYQGSLLIGSISGTYEGGNFTLDGGIDGLPLDPGTYTFICTNGYVNTSGPLWTISRENIANAQIGIVENLVISATPKLREIDFPMKNLGSRVTLSINNEALSVSPTVKFTFASTKNIVQQATFNPLTHAFTYSNAAPFSANEQVTSFTGVEGMFYKTYYFLPGTNLANLKLTFTEGTLTKYHYPLTTRYWTFPTAPVAKMNTSYRLNVSFHFNYLYLYSDGTTGKYTDADFASHTPVGIVVSRSKRLAVALNDAANTSYDASNIRPWGPSSQYSNTTASSNLADALNDFNGEDYTYNTTYSTDGLVRANEQTKYKAFYVAAHYNPGVIPTGTLAGKRWFLPSAGEWNLFHKNVRLSNNDLTNSATDDLHTFYDPNSRRLVFPDAYGMARGGGEPFHYQFRDYMYATNCYLSSSEYSYNEFWGYYTNAMRIDNGVTFDYWISKIWGMQSADKNLPGNGGSNYYFVRPFIHY